jgi:hypothetical protein
MGLPGDPQKTVAAQLKLNGTLSKVQTLVRDLTMVVVGKCISDVRVC